MAISFVTSTTYTSNAAASGTIAKPTTQTNDLMIAFLAIQDSQFIRRDQYSGGLESHRQLRIRVSEFDLFRLHPLGIRSPRSIDVSDAVAPIPQV